MFMKFLFLILISQSTMSDPQYIGSRLNQISNSAKAKDGLLANAAPVTGSANLTICQQLKANAGTFHKYMKNLTATMQKITLDGFKALGIKPIDPIYIDRFDYDYKEENVDVDGVATSIYVSNHSLNNITKFETDILKLTAEVQLHIPQLNASGYNKMHGKLFKFFPIDAKGNFYAVPRNMSLTVFGNATVIKDVLIAEYFNFTADFTGVDVHFEGVDYEGPGKEKVQDYMSDLGVNFYHKLEPKMHEQLRNVLLQLVNKLLEKVPIKEIMGIESVQNQKFPCPDE